MFKLSTHQKKSQLGLVVKPPSYIPVVHAKSTHTTFNVISVLTGKSSFGLKLTK
ncbi:hypothetical protein J5751_03355 [bacterium]|nr:hypothetical protein [bacterium]